MKHTSRHRLTILTAFLGGLATACSDRATAPLPPLANHISFSYSGDVTGSFDATGTPAAATGPFIPRGDYATAFSYDASVSVPLAGTFSAMANDDAGSPYGNMFLLFGIPAQVGTYALSNSVRGNFYLGVTWNSSFFAEQRIFGLTSGQLRVDEYTGTHVRGSFSGTATQFIPATSGAPPVITIVNGQFDLPINDPVVLQFRCTLFAC